MKTIIRSAGNKSLITSEKSTVRRSLISRLFSSVKSLLKLALLILIITAIAVTFIINTSGDEHYLSPLPLVSNNPLVVNDITQLNAIHVAKIIKPTLSSEIIQAINNSTGPISIGGGRFSMGGQVAFADSLHIDMRDFNKILALDVANKTITVQPGITWRDIQTVIDKENLAIKIMQTYANFTVGGSLSVNVHGRYIGEGPLISSVLSMKVVLASGEELFISREENSAIFYAVIGGYGGIGVITEATLSLADNTVIERSTQVMPVVDYAQHFAKNVRNNTDVVFHNGDLYPPDYDTVRDITWVTSRQQPTETDRLRAQGADYKWERIAAEFVGNYAIGKSIRQHIIDPLYYAKDKVVWRNWEASYDVRELEPKSRKDSTYVLREYFVPVDKFDQFVPIMKNIFLKHDANIINVSIRHAHSAPENMLSWARNEMFAFVVYYLQGTDKAAIEQVGVWSKAMIDAVIAVNGSYYLPYQIFASKAQFHQAYPRADEFFAIKAELDPDNRFTNQLWQRYYQLDSPQRDEVIINTLSGGLTIYEAKKQLGQYFRAEEQTMLTIPEWYLVFNPLEYAQYLAGDSNREPAENNNPSNFPFMASIDEYWRQYDRVVALGASYEQDNDEYITMLQVIGISTTVEYMYKSLYENTIGRFTYWTTDGNKTTEDITIARAHKAYSDLIFQQAWYKFDFGYWIDEIWWQSDFFGPNFIRKLERKLFFTIEFSIKSGYAKLIEFASGVSYEASDGLIYLIVDIAPEKIKLIPDRIQVLASENNQHLLSIPRWGPFTELLPELISQGANIIEISGNKNIAVSYLIPTAEPAIINTGIKLFDSVMVSNNQVKRSVKLVKVTELRRLLQELKIKGAQLEHLYDY
jgi:FAD/FMN-containing dehydrogenase